MSEVAVGPLDLSGADTTGFAPVPSGTYKASIFKATWRETQNEGKMPKGTPGLNVQFRLSEKVGSPELKVENRRVFNTYWLPGDGYEAKKRARMQGMLVTLLVNAGYDKAKVTKSGFKLDLEDVAGREIGLTLGIQPADEEKGYEAQNTVKGTKPIGSVGAASSSLI